MKFTIKENKDLNIDKVPMTCDNLDKDDLRLEKLGLPIKNSAVYMVGPPRSGKSNLIYQLLHKKQFYKKYFDEIHIFSPSLHTFQKRFLILDECTHNEFNEDKIEEILNGFDYTEKNLLLFDDMISQINKAGKSSLLRKIFFNRRHKGATIWLTSQRYNLLDLSLRNNISHLLLFKISKAELELIHDEKITSLSKDEWISLCNFVFDSPHNFLYIDLLYNTFYKNFNLITLNN